MTAVFECRRTDAKIGFSAASVASFHRPRQPGVMRPIASTAVASMQNIAAPDNASVLMCVKCQSLASPFRAEYWHIGATMMRFEGSRPRSLIGENRTLMSGYPDGREIPRPCLAGGRALLNRPAKVVFTLVDLKR